MVPKRSSRGAAVPGELPRRGENREGADRKLMDALRSKEIRRALQVMERMRRIHTGERIIDEYDDVHYIRMPMI